MRHFFPITALLVVTALLPADGSHLVAEQSPKAVVERPLVDLGTVGLGANPEVEFTIRNDGPGTLELAVERMPRGIELKHLDRTASAAGSAAVRVVLDTFRVGAEREWRIALRTNEPEQPIVELAVRAEVREVLALDPPAARFTFVQFGPEGGTSHVLTALDGTDIDVAGVESPFPFLTTSLRELTGAARRADTPGRQWQVSLTIAKNAPVGPIGGHVLIRTNHPVQPTAYLPVTGFVRPLFAVTPPTVNLGTVSAAPDDRPLVTLVVRNFGTDAIEVVRAECSNPALTTTILEVEAGHTWRVQVRSAPDAPAAGSLAGTIRILTKSVDVPELTVPVQGARVAGAVR